MTILICALAVAFAAFCVWLTVRIVNRRERWAKWTLAGMIGVPLLYVGNFGAWCRIMSQNGRSAKIPIIYQPIVVPAKQNSYARNVVTWYATRFTPNNWTVMWCLIASEMPVWLWRELD
jgi:hypothetical protein